MRHYTITLAFNFLISFFLPLLARQKLMHSLTEHFPIWLLNIHFLVQFNRILAFFQYSSIPIIPTRNRYQHFPMIRSLL